MTNYLQTFLKNHQLTDAYLTSAQTHFKKLIDQLVAKQQQAQQTITLGLNGSQGSGKTTLADYLNTILTHQYGLKVISLSIDDFYLSKAARLQLAADVHPLLATRGVPGTHDVDLALQTINALKQQGRVSIPRFNKATDDNVDPDQWATIDTPVDIIIFEGWCLGAEPQTETALQNPINTLEQNQDTDARWRNYVNNQLKGQYQGLFGLVDVWAMLKAPSFDCIYHWRLEQEHKLKQRKGQGSGIMSDADIKQFVMYFQRITEQLLISLPVKVDFLYALDKQRQIT